MGLKMLTVLNITAPLSRRNGTIVESKPDTSRQYNADIQKNVSIRLHGFTTQLNSTSRAYAPVAFNKTFELGGHAEYDAYNLSYVGVITAIGEKTVTIQDGKKTRRLSLYEFAWRNHDFDRGTIAARNSETLQCI